ncbi:MAG: response regulator transcription factor [Rhodospirillales bacterium]|nr:response regulator transcription factor [Rhodospirillales bacterium]
MSVSPARIAIIDDDPKIRRNIAAYLTDEGFEVHEAENGDGLDEFTAQAMPDLILLEQRLPGTDGLDLVRRLRRDAPGVGIIMFSGKKDVIDRVAGLEVGADDYLIKPFHLRELLARIRSVLRRLGVPDTSKTPPVGGRQDRRQWNKTLHFDGWMLDRDARTLASPMGQPVKLTSGTFDLLVAFASHPNRVLSREQLLDFVGNGEASPFDRSIDVQVGRLRRRIERDPKRPAIIKTVRNVGYMLSADVREIRHQAA